jgi:hypothetical protein
MVADAERAFEHQAHRRLVQRVLEGGIPNGVEFDACRATLGFGAASDNAMQALCTLLEGALADPKLDIDDTQIVVPLLRRLARGAVSVEELL